jgi:multicomponent Na+:H+ antiporter subunit F
MPAALLLTLAAVVLVSMLVALVRVVRGPGPSDRMAGALLLGTAGVAVLLLLAEAYAAPALRDTALVLALLAAVTAIAFAALGGGRLARAQGAEREAEGGRAPREPRP